MHNPWTPEELEILKRPETAAELARQLGRSVASVQNQRSRRGIKAAHIVPPPAAAPTTVHEDLKVRDEAYWQEQHSELGKKYRKLLKAETLVERLASRVAALAPLSYDPLPPVVRSGRTSSGKAQSAVLMLSDQHIGKVVSPSQTLTFGEYNFEIFMARLKYLEESVLSIVENHTTTSVPELVITMLGDALDGTLTHSNEVGQLDTIFDQFYSGAHVTAQFLRNLAPHFPKIRIYSVAGNHARFQNQRRMPTRNRYSNFDSFFYALTRELVRDIKTISWDLNKQPYQLFEVQGFTFFAMHGDTLRGGDKTLGIPNHAVGRLISTATQLLNKYNCKAPNFYCVGHLHREITLPHATGSVLINGGFIGVDEFGLSEMFAPADASQHLFFVHPVYSKVASYNVGLKFAEVGQEAPYAVPSEFQMH
jgi:hypothetical protein